MERPELTPEEARKDHWHMLRFMMLHALVGGLIGAATAAAVILLDIGGIGTRIARAADPVMPVLLLDFHEGGHTGATAAFSVLQVVLLLFIVGGANLLGRMTTVR